MIFIKTDEEVELIRKSSLLVAKAHAEVAKMIKPGVTTLQLDNALRSTLMTMEVNLLSRVTMGFQTHCVCYLR